MLAVLEDDDPRAGVIRDELHRVIDDYPYYAQKYLKIAVKSAEGVGLVGKFFHFLGRLFCHFSHALLMFLH